MVAVTNFATLEFMLCRMQQLQQVELVIWTLPVSKKVLDLAMKMEKVTKLKRVERHLQNLCR
jgi:hypothetical protein